jgi:hypothetical protein
MRRALLICVVCLFGAGGAVASPLAASHPTARAAAQAHAAGVRSCPRVGPATSAVKGVLFGDRRVEPNVDAVRAGWAQAVAFRSGSRGTVSSVSLYVDRHNRATKVAIGVYSGSGCGPGSMITGGLQPRPKGGAWNTVKVRSAGISARRTYWLVVLGSGGTLEIRDRGRASCRTVVSQQRHMIEMSGCVLSAYARTSLSTVRHGTLGTPSPSGQTGTGGSSGGGQTGGRPGTGSGGGSGTGTAPGSTGPIPPSPPVPLNTSAPTVTGTPQVGAQLSGTPGIWSGSPTSYAYAWKDCNSGGTGCVPIPGATLSSYIVGPADAGDTIVLAVTAYHNSLSASATSSPTAVVTTPSAPGAPASTAAPQLSGGAQEGQTLAATAGAWRNSPAGYSYQWYDCDAVGNNCAAIAGATNPTYSPQPSDLGYTEKAAVTASNGAGSATAFSPLSPAIGVPRWNPSTDANLWVSPGGGSCARNAVPAVYNAATACGSLAAAYAIAQCGDVVEIENGDYGASSPTLSDRPALDSCTSPVYFEAAAGATPVFAGIDSGYAAKGASNYVIQHISLTEPQAACPAAVGAGNCDTVFLAGGRNVTLDDISGGGVRIFGATHVLVENSNLGPCYGGTVITGGCGASLTVDSGWGGYQTDDVTYRSNSIQNFIGNASTGDFACLSWRGGGDVMIDSNYFHHCERHAIYVQPTDGLCSGGSGCPWDTIIQNNWFDEVLNGVAGCTALPCDGSPRPDGVDFAASTAYEHENEQNIIVRYNSLGSGVGLMTESSSQSGNGAGNVAVGNIAGAQFGCVAGVTYADNVYGSGAGCASSDTTVGTLPYLNSSQGTENLHTRCGSTATNYVPADANQSVAYDMEGNVRPVGAQDAGSLVEQSCGGVFFAGSATGNGSGTDCANARSVSDLGTSTYWVAGTTIHLCGQITRAITAQGSGTSGASITVKWEPGATISMPVCPSTGCFNSHGQSYLRLDGGLMPYGGQAGSILGTANGTLLANHTAGSVGINATGCNGCTITNLEIGGMYVHYYNASTNPSDLADRSSTGVLISGNNWTVSDDRIHDAYNALNPSWGTNDTVDHNAFYNDNGDITGGAAAAGGHLGPIYIHDNAFHDWNTWDDSSGSNHHDGIHCFAGAAPATPPHYDAYYLYNNRFYGNIGLHEMDSTTVFEWQGRSSTCADPTSQMYVFNNIYTTDGDDQQGLLALGSGNVHAYNNTLENADNVGGGTHSGRDFDSEASNMDELNNVATTAWELQCVGPTCGANQGGTNYSVGGVFAPGSPDHNLYANSGGFAFMCGNPNTSWFGISSFASWRSCIGGDGTSAADTTTTVPINRDGTLVSGSRALGAGTNLTSLCAGGLVPLCSEISGVARPSVGAWNAGAY